MSSSTRRTYRRPMRTMARRRLSYPRGTSRRGQWRSRGPYRVNPSNRPELKNFDWSCPPLPISYGDINGSYQWQQVANPWESFNGSNQDTVLLGGPGLYPGPGETLAFTGGICSQILQGYGPNQRIGSKIVLKSLLLHFSIRGPVSQTGGAVTVALDPITFRVLVIQDKQPNGTLPKVSDILQPVFDIVEKYPMPNSPNNLDNRDRFRTLLDLKDTLSPSGDEVRNFDRYLPLKDISVTYAAGGAGGVQSNDVYIFVMSDGYLDVTSNPFYDNRPMLRPSWRLRYTDC